MSVLVVSLYNVSTIAPAVMLDQLQVELDKGEGSEVYLLSCLKTFDRCYVNKDAQKANCFYCESAFRNNLKLIKGQFQVVKLAELISEDDHRCASEFFGNHAFNDRSVMYENYDVVEAAVSSYITKTRDKELTRTNVDEFLLPVTYNSVLIFESVKRFIIEKGIDKVIIFNGRFDYIRAVLRLCQQLNIHCEVLERVRPGGYIESFQNALPHTITERQRLVDEAWNDSGIPYKDKYEIGSSYFRRKRKGEAIIARSFILHQTKNLLPDKVDLSKKNIVLFNSSDDEIAAVGQMYRNPFFKDQETGTEFLVELIGTKHVDCNLIIRMHPNLRGINYNYVTVIKGLHQKFPNIYVIPPESNVDSYALLDCAWKVISFGTSMGLEASYWGKPVILLAKARYFYADVAYVPSERNDIDRLISAELSAKDQVNAIKFGYYYVNGGRKAKYYDSSSLTSNFFKGRPLYKFSLLQRIVGGLLGRIDRWSKSAQVVP